MDSRFLPLLVVLLLMLFFVYPLSLQSGHAGPLLNIFLFVMFLVSLRAMASNRAVLRLILVLALPLVALRVGHETAEGTWMVVTYSLISMVLFGVVMLVCLNRVLDTSPVNEDKILGAICVYLLIGLLFAFLYEVIYTLDPTAIALGDSIVDVEAESFWAFTYFSFVTLTTLGYGDVLPVGLFARSMATLEAIVGPLYLAILIARLVGAVQAQPSRRRVQGQQRAEREKPS